jgi:uncharacterized membrane protein YhhN
MSRLLLFSSLLASAIYASTFVFGPFSGSWAVKACSVALLALLMRRHSLLAVGLLLGSIGDALLDFDQQHFMAGLIAFLLGHLVYTVCFWRAGRRIPGPGRQAALLLCAAVFLTWLWPRLGALQGPVAVYFAAITAMVLASFRVGGWVAVGALLFLASDALLAAERFGLRIPLRDWIVWFPYYFGQLSIATGYLRSQSATPLTPDASPDGHGWAEP